MIAKNFVVTPIGKTIASTKMKHEWFFNLHHHEYILTLIVSYRSGKYSVTLNNETELYYENRSYDKEPFKYEVVLENELFQIQQRDKKFELNYQGRNFHSYLAHSVIHVMGDKKDHSPQIKILPFIPKSVDALNFVPDSTKSKTHDPIILEKSRTDPLLFPVDNFFNYSQNIIESHLNDPEFMVKINGTCTLEGFADVFLDNDFPVGTESTVHIYQLVHNN